MSCNILKVSISTHTHTCTHIAVTRVFYNCIGRPSADGQAAAERQVGWVEEALWTHSNLLPLHTHTHIHKTNKQTHGHAVPPPSYISVAVYSIPLVVYTICVIFLYVRVYTTHPCFSMCAQGEVRENTMAERPPWTQTPFGRG